MLTNEQFQNKIKKLRAKKDLHEKLALVYRDKIDILVKEREHVLSPDLKNHYIEYGEACFFVEKTKAGTYYLQALGTGFCCSPARDRVTRITRLHVSWSEISQIKFITKDEFEAKFKNAVQEISDLLSSTQTK